MSQVNIIRCQILIVIALLRTTRGSELTIAELTPQHSEEIIRQTKSAQILRYMNESVDPCEDFYEFTCGNYAKYHPVSKQQPRVNVLDLLDNEMTQKVKGLLETMDVEDTVADRKVKNFYKSCLNAQNTFKTFGQQLRTVIEDFGPMPVLQGSDWQEDNFDWAQTLAQIIYKSGIDVVLGVDVVEDLDDDTISRVAIGESTLLLEKRAFYVDQSLSDKLNNLVDTIALYLKKMFGVERETAQQVANEIKDFEVALARGMTDEKLGLTLKEQFHLTDVKQMQRKNWHFWDFKKMLNDSLGLVPNELYVDHRYVETALNAVQNTPKRVVANYMFYKYLTNFFPFVSEDRSILEYLCMDATKKQFNEILDNMIYRQYVTLQMEENIYQMWRELKKAFGNTLESSRLEWIHKDTRSEALNKLKLMKMVINSYEKTNFTEEFDQLDLNDVDYIHNIEAILITDGKRFREQLTQPPENGEPEGGSSYSPTYKPSENTVFMTLGALQPFYLSSNSYPNAYNFGSLGGFMGHEMVHGFDDTGREYDSKGNERNWWGSESANNFRDRTKCFVDQYKQYIYGGKPLPESPLQSENIADNGGLRLAYEAYLNWYDNAQSNVSLESFPGLNYTRRQLFFVSFAHTWCSVVDPDYMAIITATHTHTPDKFRVIGSLSNYDEFSKSFNCPQGSGMNPVNKCEIY